MWNLVLLLLSISLLIPGPSAQAVGGWVLYDNFSTNSIDVSKWSGQEEDNDDGLMTDVVREINLNRLRLMMAAYGSSSTKYPRNKLTFRHAEDITAIRATIKIRKFEVQGCSSNEYFQNAARASIVAFLFNVNEGGPQENSYVGDIRASIRVRSSAGSPDQLKVEAHVIRCDDAICADSPVLFYKDLDTVNKDEPVTCSMIWDKIAKKITFTAQKTNSKGVSGVYNYSKMYGSDYPLASMGATKGLRVDHALASCTDEPPPRAQMEAFFDNVYIKTSSD